MTKSPSLAKIFPFLALKIPFYSNSQLSFPGMIGHPCLKTTRIFWAISLKWSTSVVDGWWESILHAEHMITDDINIASRDMCPGLFTTKMFVVVQTCALSQIAMLEKTIPSGSDKLRLFECPFSSPPTPNSCVSIFREFPILHFL